MKPFTRPSALLAALLLAAPAQAGLLSDDEAHAKIAELQKQNAQLQSRLEASEKTGRNLHLDGQAQIEALRVELSKLRGQLEEQAHAIETTQKRQRDLYIDTDTRLRQLEENKSAPPPPPEPEKVRKPGTKSAAVVENEKPLTPGPADEGKSYDEAFSLFKAGNYAAALEAFQKFVQTWPKSPLAPSAQYWIGNSYFNLKDYHAAIASQKTLLSQYPKSPKAPDAMLNIATCQQNLGDGEAARKSLEELVSRFPLSDAGEKAKKRLEAMK